MLSTTSEKRNSNRIEGEIRFTFSTGSCQLSSKHNSQWPPIRNQFYAANLLWWLWVSAPGMWDFGPNDGRRPALLTTQRLKPRKADKMAQIYGGGTWQHFRLRGWCSCWCWADAADAVAPGNVLFCCKMQMSGRHRRHGEISAGSNGNKWKMCAAKPRGHDFNMQISPGKQPKCNFEMLQMRSGRVLCGF